MTSGLVRFFYKYLYRFFVPFWYGLTMNLTRFRRWPRLSSYTTTRQITEALNWGQNWRPDPLKGNFDVLMDPRKFQAKIDAGDDEFGDCDDHAMYWCTALLQGGLADRVWFSSVWYANAGDKGSGHVVCVFEKDGEQYWCDYRDPTPVVIHWGWARQVATGYGKLPIAAGMIEVRLRKSGAPRFKFSGVRVTADLM
jgi:hypothetical protein